MPSEGALSRARRIWLYPVLLLGSAAVVAFFGFYLFDWFHWAPSTEELGGMHAAAKPAPLDQLFGFDPDTAQNALGSLAQVIAAVLGIVITVVSIVVQLAATRYTSRVADMFFRDKLNLVVLGFFVVAGIDAVWVSVSVSRWFVPRATITASLGLVTVSVLLMVPYFAYVFDFLDPERVVARIQEQALASALGAVDDAGAADTGLRQTRVVQSVEQLADVAMNAISQKDKLIAQGAVDALKQLAIRYLPEKARIRSRDAAWFQLSARLRQNPDFVSMSPESLEDLAQRNVWLEWKLLRQYQAVFAESLGQMPDMCYLVAIDTRYIGEAALATKDEGALGLVVKFFNTYLRTTLNGGQVRTAYNILNQYRHLTERMLDGEQDALAVEVAGYFRYYGQVAHGKGLGFVTETVAYDLAALIEEAHGRASKAHDALLKVLLDLDREGENAEQEKALRGVRKAQAKLASFYLAAGDEAHARTIYADMKDESPTRLASIRDELLAVVSKDYWEVIDRGSNFDYMDAARKEKLVAFFSWFPSLAKTPAKVSNA